LLQSCSFYPVVMPMIMTIPMAIMIMQARVITMNHTMIKMTMHHMMITMTMHHPVITMTMPPVLITMATGTRMSLQLP